jgi:hypothetical protein
MSFIFQRRQSALDVSDDVDEFLGTRKMHQLTRLAHYEPERAKPKINQSTPVADA